MVQPRVSGMSEHAHWLFRWCSSSSMQLCVSQSLALHEARMLSSDQLVAQLGVSATGPSGPLHEGNASSEGGEGSERRAGASKPQAPRMPEQPPEAEVWCAGEDRGAVCLVASQSSAIACTLAASSRSHFEDAGWQGDSPTAASPKDASPFEAPLAADPTGASPSEAGTEPPPRDELELEALSAACTEETWESGTVRVLVLQAPCAHRGANISKWSRGFGLTDVTLLETAEAEPAARAARDLGRRCEPGDICVVCLDGFAAGVTAGVNTPFPQAIGAKLLESLPSYVVVVAIVGSREDSEVLRLQTAITGSARMLRAVEIGIYPGGGQQRLCFSSVLRAADALSLADAPCSLSCRAFFDEVAEQAQDAAAAKGAPVPHADFRAYPETFAADSVRWPIAKKPHNSTKVSLAPPAAAMPEAEPEETVLADSCKVLVGKGFPVVSWNPYHMSHGYSRDFFGAYALDAADLRPGDRIRVNGTELSFVRAEDPGGHTDASGKTVLHVHVSPDLCAVEGGSARDGDTWHRAERLKRSVAGQGARGRKRSGSCETRGVPTSFGALSHMLTGAGRLSKTEKRVPSRGRKLNSADEVRRALRSGDP